MNLSTAPRVERTTSSELVGRLVVNDSGERLGTITDVAIDAASARVSHVVIAATGGGAKERKTLHVPWDALRFEPLGIVLNATPRELQRAVGVDPLPQIGVPFFG